MERSFLKWVGGKSSALKPLLANVPQSGGVLVEPFMGSCTVALNFDYERYILNDSNPDLVYLCEWVVRNPKEIISLLQPLFVATNNTKVRYYELRAQYNASNCQKERALLFAYINRHCYNGLMRYNNSGGMNTPAGAYKNPKVPVDAMHAFSKKLKGKVRFTCSDFRQLKFIAGSDVTVYCDPPYIPISKTASFTAYNPGGFGALHHAQLNKRCRVWAQRGASVWLSNNCVDVLNQFYKDAKEQVEFMVPRTVSRDIANRNPVREALLSY
jgi:DNA adenine methylase